MSTLTATVANEAPHARLTKALAPATVNLTTEVHSDHNEAQTLLAKLPTVRANLNYLDRSVTRPWTIVHPEHDESKDGPRTNHIPHTVPVLIRDLSEPSLSEDARRNILGLNLDQAGFDVVDGWGDDGGSGIALDWANERWDEEGFFEDVYYKDIEALLKKHTGGTSVYVFDRTVRKRDRKQGPTVPGPETRQPVAFVHVDQNRSAGEGRVRRHLGQDVLDRVLRCELRAQLINVWRPLRGPAVVEWPLAFGDYRSIAAEDWRDSELRYKEWVGETFSVHSNPAHRFFYYSNMPPDKAVLLKCYDSATDVCTPHTAFEHPDTPDNAPPRWSVEVRAIVLTETGQKSLA